MNFGSGLSSLGRWFLVGFMLHYLSFTGIFRMVISLFFKKCIPYGRKMDGIWNIIVDFLICQGCFGTYSASSSKAGRYCSMNSET